MEDRRGAGLRTGLDIRRTAHDHPGHRQGAQHAAQHVADALGRQFPVEVRALAAVHTVHRSCRQQGLGAGDEGQGECGHQQGRVGQVHQIIQAYPVDGLRKVCRYLNPIHRQGQP
ncbi:hypothetical protein D3C81_1394750 [compost metagenome]